MWQRKQTIFLGLAAISMALLLFLPMVLLMSDSLVFEFNALGWRRISGVANAESVDFQFRLLPFALNVLVTILAVATIFFYKKRKLQIRLSIFNLLLCVAFVGVVAFYAFTFEGGISIRPWLFLPLITMLFLYLAIRGIVADEILIRSTQRLR
ncbi:MAG: DUF4293 domain-containing protein [Porphyromonas sp.]|nr:DUF4293 domain-containing protein [Porphyromonas sp.]